MGKFASFLGIWMMVLTGVAGAKPVMFTQDLQQKAEQIEDALYARVGLAVIDTQTGKSWSHRGEERFPLASTFKAFACGALLARIDAGQDDMMRLSDIHKGDIVTWSPVTKKKVGKSMTRDELCEAALVYSDNTAANKVLERVGGPSGLTSFMDTALGDEVTRLDRWEPDLNEGVPNDRRDSTSPQAVVQSLQHLLFGSTLSEESREQLLAWMKATKVSRDIIDGVLPPKWRIAYRSGAAGHGTRNLLAVIWPQGRKPVIFAAYLTEAEGNLEDHNKAVSSLLSTLVKAYADPLGS